MRAEAYQGDFMDSLVLTVIGAEKQDMSDLDKMKAIQDAAGILWSARLGIADKTHTVWAKLAHAQRYLDGQMKELLQEESHA